MEDQDNNGKIKLYTYDILKKLTQQSYIICYEKVELSKYIISLWCIDKQDT